MSLYNELVSISKSYWCYYEGITVLNYKETIDNPLNFIESYFYYAGKNDFLYKSLFDFQQEDNPEQIKRAIHTVNTFFFGLYLKQKIDYLNPHKISFLAKDNNFLWAWFLCSLYHDAFFDKNEDIIVKCHYNRFIYGLLYKPNLIKRYYEKCKNPDTAYKNKPKCDHGIVAAEKLFRNYSDMVKIASNNANIDFENFRINDELDFYGLKINNSTFHAMCKIAKIIACHNIFVANDETRDTYSNIPELIPGNKKFFYMPNSKNRHIINSYEKLYFLLALVDTLEPSKRGIDLKDIDIQVDKIQQSKYVLRIEMLATLDKQKEYYNGIKQLGNWLNFVVTSENGHEIRIDFHHNKNCGSNLVNPSK